jgi:hypothetical protein
MIDPQSYIRRVADMVGLTDWTFLVVIDDDCELDDDTGAHCHPIYGRRHARITLCADWHELDADAQRYIVCHELMHCHFAIPGALVCDDLGQHLSQSVYDTFTASFRREMEHGIDAVATVVALSVPLPSEWIK